MYWFKRKYQPTDYVVVVCYCSVSERPCLTPAQRCLGVPAVTQDTEAAAQPTTQPGHIARHVVTGGELGNVSAHLTPSHRPYTLATARQCLHLTSLLFLVPDVFCSCCKTYCEFQLLNLLQSRACCFMFLYSRGHSLFGPMNGQAGDLPAYILL